MSKSDVIRLAIQAMKFEGIDVQVAQLHGTERPTLAIIIPDAVMRDGMVTATDDNGAIGGGG